MPHYKYSNEDYHTLANAPCIDVAMALGMEIDESRSDQKAWKIKGEQGLCIYRDGNNWYRFSDGKTGFPIDLVIDKLGCTKTQALDFIARNVVHGVSEQVQLWHLSAKPEKRAQLPKEKTFTVPEHSTSPKRVMAYLVKTRGIDAKIVTALIQHKLIAESTEHHNCLFFGRDEGGNVRSCALRGTASDVKFRGEVAGGDKAYTFAMTGKNKVLRLFESPIDAMSHATFTKLLGKDWEQDHRLSVNGCGNYDSIKKYLDNHTEISSVWFNYDNDEGGRVGTAVAIEKLKHDFPERKLDIHTAIPAHGKDWNEELQIFRQTESTVNVKDFLFGNSTLSFLYHGVHFEPVGILPPNSSLGDISQDIVPDEAIGANYSADTFKQAVKADGYDLYKCAESGKIYLPFESGLYQYSGEYLPHQREAQTPQETPSRIEESSNDEDEEYDMEM